MDGQGNGRWQSTSAQAETIMITTIAADHREVRGGQSVMTHQLTLLGGRIKQHRERRNSQPAFIVAALSRSLVVGASPARSAPLRAGAMSRISLREARGAEAGATARRSSAGNITSADHTYLGPEFHRDRPATRKNSRGQEPRRPGLHRAASRQAHRAKLWAPGSDPRGAWALRLFSGRTCPHPRPLCSKSRRIYATIYAALAPFSRPEGASRIFWVAEMARICARTYTGDDRMTVTAEGAQGIADPAPFLADQWSDCDARV